MFRISISFDTSISYRERLPKNKLRKRQPLKEKNDILQILLKTEIHNNSFFFSNLYRPFIIYHWRSKSCSLF